MSQPAGHVGPHRGVIDSARSLLPSRGLQNSRGSLALKYSGGKPYCASFSPCCRPEGGTVIRLHRAGVVNNASALPFFRYQIRRFSASGARIQTDFNGCHRICPHRRFGASPFFIFSASRAAPVGQASFSCGDDLHGFKAGEEIGCRFATSRADGKRARFPTSASGLGGASGAAHLHTVKTACGAEANGAVKVRFGAGVKKVVKS